MFRRSWLAPSESYSQAAEDQELALQLLADHELADQLDALQLLADHELADQLLALQLLADQELADQLDALQLLADQELADQLDAAHSFPFHAPPDQLKAFASAFAIAALSNGARKMSIWPDRTWPSKASRLDPRAESSVPSPSDQ